MLDADDVAGSTLVADVCIVGAGPAGVGVASVLAQRDVSVVVLESGGPYVDRHRRSNTGKAVLDHISGAQSATRGSNTGHPYFPLRLSRARGIGGSTAALLQHGLRSRPLDEIDFEARFGPGWPVPYEEFAVDVHDAAVLCGLPAELPDWTARRDPDLVGSASPVRTIEFRHGGRRAIADAAESLSSLATQRWLFGATVTRLGVDGTGAVTRVEAATGSGERLAVQARTVVLAAGGIDNARMLLVNTPVLGAMGSSARHVGRHFMEHLHYVAGFLVPSNEGSRRRVHDVYCDRNEERWITVDDETVRSAGIARSAFIPIPADSSSIRPGVRSFGRLIRAVPFGPFARDLWKRELSDLWDDRAAVASAIRGRFRSRETYDCFVLGAMSEQVPNQASRVELADATDRYGMPRANLHWDLDERDLDSARRSAHIVGESLERAGLGEYVPIWSDSRTPEFHGGWHHMGTTRMSQDPDDGVVDGNARVHGMTNLYVAGSSVFPSGGFANPTLSLVALAVRLGRHIADGVDE